MFIYFLKYTANPQKEDFFAGVIKKTSVTVNSSLVGRSILKQCVQKSHLKVIQIGLQLGTAILRVGCQAQDSIVCEQVDFKNKDLREASKLLYCSNLLVSISNHNDDDNDNIKFIFLAAFLLLSSSLLIIKLPIILIQTLYFSGLAFCSFTE